MAWKEAIEQSPQNMGELHSGTTVYYVGLDHQGQPFTSYLTKGQDVRYLC